MKRRLAFFTDCCTSTVDECDVCTSWPSEFQVTISGVVSGSECPGWLGTCNAINDTFILDDASDLGVPNDCALAVAYDLGASGNCTRYILIILSIGESGGNLILYVDLYRVPGLVLSPATLLASYQTVLSTSIPYDCASINETIPAAAMSGETTVCDATSSQVVVVAVP